MADGGEYSREKDPNVREDGTKVTFVDGKKIIEYPNGALVTECPDGTTITEAAGKKVTEKPDGTKITETAMGTTIEHPDGTVEKQTPLAFDLLKMAAGMAMIGAVADDERAERSQGLSGQNPLSMLLKAFHLIGDDTLRQEKEGPRAALKIKPPAPGA